MRVLGAARGMARAAGNKMPGRSSVAFRAANLDSPDSQLRKAVEANNGFVNRSGVAVLPVGDDSSFAQVLSRLSDGGSPVAVEALNPASRRVQATALVPKEAISNLEPGVYGSLEREDIARLTGPSNRQIEIPVQELKANYNKASSGLAGNFYDDNVVSGEIKQVANGGLGEVTFQRYTRDGNLSMYDPRLDSNLPKAQAEAQYAQLYDPEQNTGRSLAKLSSNFQAKVNSPEGYGTYLNVPLDGLGENGSGGERAQMYRNFGFVDVPEYASQVLDTRRFNNVEDGMLIAAGDEIFNPDMAPYLRESRRLQMQQNATNPARVRRISRQAGQDITEGMQQLPLTAYEIQADPRFAQTPKMAADRAARSNFFADPQGKIALEQEIAARMGAANNVVPVYTGEINYDKPVRAEKLSSENLMSDEDLMAALYAM